MPILHMSLATPPGFNFMRTARSHGWYALPPFSLDTDNRTLSRVLELEGGILARCTISERARRLNVDVEIGRKPTPRQRAHIKAQLRSCLRMDEDFGEFHREARRHPAYRWISRTGSGRMLRSPTVFEDTVKMLCTTNCTWELTTIIVNNLVQHFGKSSSHGWYAFPNAEAIAGSTESFLRKHIKSGYRSPFLLELAQAVASGTLDIESWRTSSLTTDELFKTIRTVKGLGPYAAGNILKLLGRYDYLGLDSWVRMKYYEMHTGGRAVKDSTIERMYRHLGTWRGLFFWLEMTRYWHDGKFRI